jgi:large subunit ribosomal protein L18e
MKNEQLTKTISEMKKLSIDQKVGFWKKIASELEKPARHMRTVNVEKIDRTVKEGETAVVPGKVLGPGKTKIKIACLNCSESVKKENSIITLNELMKKEPKGKNCRIIC